MKPNKISSNKRISAIAVAGIVVTAAVSSSGNDRIIGYAVDISIVR